MKPGWKTTEFWISLAASVGAILAAAAGFLPPNYAGIAVAVSSSAYTLSRGLAKSAPTAMGTATAPPPDGGPRTAMGREGPQS